MIDTKVLLAIALLLGTLGIGSAPHEPSGGVPIPQVGAGTAQ